VKPIGEGENPVVGREHGEIIKEMREIGELGGHRERKYGNKGNRRN
jgi:hypothetical protein